MNQKKPIETKYFYGIKPLRFIDHGEWADPEVRVGNRVCNYYDLEDPMWEDFKQESKEHGKVYKDEQERMNAFDDYRGKHGTDAIELFDMVAHEED